LKQGIHDNEYLQRAWDKYGESEFDFDIIELCDEDQLDSREEHHINRLGALCRDTGYNLGIVVKGNKRHSAESKLKMSIAQKAVRQNNPPRIPSIETRAKIALAGTGRTHSPATLAKMSAVQSARMNLPENKAHMSSVMKGHTKSAETCAKISESKKGKAMHPHTREAIRQANTGKVLTAEHKAKIAAANKGRKGYVMSDEAKARMSISMKGVPKTPEHRAKIKIALQARALERRHAKETAASVIDALEGFDFS